jgi:polyphosphate kinase 2 (PPK2 family)
MTEYKQELRKLQTELVKLQKWVQKENQRIVIIFEGRDSAGKGGAIRRFARYLNPRAVRVVALPKPTEYERAQWFFQRYIAELPSS